MVLGWAVVVEVSQWVVPVKETKSGDDAGCRLRVGRLSYSQSLGLTRLGVDKDQLCELALEMTASQLARAIATYRSLTGTRIQGLPKRRFMSRPAGEGMVRLSVVLPAEEAALITAAVESAARRASHQDEPTDELLQAPQPAARWTWSKACSMWPRRIWTMSGACLPMTTLW